MKFKLISTDTDYDDGAICHYLKKEYLDILKKNKFKYTEETFIDKWDWHHFIIIIDIENMEELMKLKEKVNHELIIADSWGLKRELNTIEIYDGYRE